MAISPAKTTRLRETWHTRWPLYITRLPPFPLFVTVFLILSVLFFSFAPHQYHRVIQHHQAPPTSSLFNGYGERQNPGRIRAIEAPRRNVWNDLTDGEIQGVVDVLGKQRDAVGIPKTAEIAFVERLMPNKTHVLPFLRDAEHSVQDWARVVMVSRKVWGGKEGGLSEWMVGPLPATSETQVLPLSYIYNSGRNTISRPMPDIVPMLLWFNRLVNGPLKDMMKDLLEEIPDFSAMTKLPGLMTMSSPTSREDDPTIFSGWLTVHAFGYLGIRDAFSLLPQGMYAHFAVRGLEESDWQISEWFYGGVIYNSTEAFHHAWREGKVHKTLPNKDGDWTNAEPDEEDMPGRDVAPPVLVQPYGPRVEVNKKQKYVKWLDWEFYLSFSQVTALSLFDIRFKNERIMYELGLQEAMAHYAGNSPASVGQLFFDTMFGFGLNTYSLVPGFDCPAYATYLPVGIYREGKFQEKENAICVFEAVSDHLLQRHTSMNKVTVSKNSYLVVRTVSTVGNYDYTISYIFYLDGSIEVKVHASGYIFTDYIALDAMRKELATRGETQISEYGYRVHDVVVSSLHTHEILFKADLDVAGTDNTIYQVEVEPITRQYGFEPGPRNTMHLVHNPVKHESGLDWRPNSQGIYVVLNNASENAWGEKRGYKIVPGTGMGTPPHLAIINSTAAGKAAGWAMHDLWILKQHDHEPRAVSEWGSWERHDPLIDFDKMVNNEKTVQEDLVVYFNLGVHHISNSQDIPNTLMHWSGTSVMFIPHNYHDRDPSRRSAQGVMMKLGAEKPENITHYGARYDKDVFVRQDDIEPSLKDYTSPTYGIGALSHNATL